MILLSRGRFEHIIIKCQQNYYADRILAGIKENNKEKVDDT